jgi:hypothetical protein
MKIEQALPSLGMFILHRNIRRRSSPSRIARRSLVKAGAGESGDVENLVMAVKATAR